MTESARDAAKIYSNQRTVPIYIGEGDGFRLPGKAKWRPADALAAILGGITTAGLVTSSIMAGHAHTALYILIIGAAVTVGAVAVLGRLPVLRPAPIVRAVWLITNLVPRIRESG